MLESVVISWKKLRTMNYTCIKRAPPSFEESVSWANSNRIQLVSLRVDGLVNHTLVCSLHAVVGCKEPAQRSRLVVVVGSNKGCFVFCCHCGKVQAKATRRASSEGYVPILDGNEVVSG